MSTDILAHLPQVNAKHPRQFVSPDCKGIQWEDYSPYYQDLLERPLASVEELEEWIKHWSELQSVFLEVSSRLYINMTCFTNDPENSQAYEHFISEIDPKISLSEDALNKKITQHPLSEHLDKHFQLWLHSMKNEISLFLEKNIAIQTEISLETQAYQKVTGAMSVEFEGKTRTMPEMGSFQEKQDRTLREKAWRASAERRLQDTETLNKHFETLFEKRLQISKNLGFASFVDYIFQAKERFDYTPQHCYDFHEAVEKEVVPRYRALMKKRAQKMGLETLRPWDFSCDPEGRTPLKPFTDTKDLIAGCSKIFHAIDPQLGTWLDHMKENNLLDMDSRIGKAPGGYQCGLEENRLPFIFMNAVGTNSDVFTLLHEAGHSFHQYLMGEIQPTGYRHIHSEIAEVASMSMERIGSHFLEEFYTPAEAARARIGELEEVIRLLPWVATIDAFQLWMYSNPKHTAEERKAYWLELQKRFGPETDWTGLEQYQDHSWHRQLHIFEVPFYYIEYGIAQLGALGVWKNWTQNPDEAMAKYKKGLSLGGSKPLPELFEATGIPFDFSRATIAPLMELIDQTLAQEEDA